MRIIKKSQSRRTASSLGAFMRSTIARLRESGRFRTAETYNSALVSFSKFLGSLDGDIAFDAVTPELMERYEAWHRRRGVTDNTISFYMRILRAVYNRAVEWGITADRCPFRRVYTGIDKTVKRALPVVTLRRIGRLDLEAYPRLAFARDLFLLSFRLRGMSFVDMAYLRKSDLCAGRLTYRRRKTGRQLSIAWTREMQSFVTRYPCPDGPYLLPIISPDGDARKEYRNATYRINRALDKIGRMMGLVEPLTFYVARHSWASTAKSAGVTLSVISEGMGHQSEATTRIYLASLDMTPVDRANEQVIRAIE